MMATPDWNTLERLRSGFIEGNAGERDYWQSESDLENYNATFAQRIAWKWQYVLQELQERAWQAPQGAVLDIGCGSGIAGRSVVEAWGTSICTSLALHDRSAIAMKFATQKAQEQFPMLPAHELPELTIAGGTVLISHLITELSTAQIQALCQQLIHADVVLWIEPGSYDASRALMAVRELLRHHFHVVAPCIHTAECGMANPVNHRHWCHFFATPPDEAFMQREWAQFADNTGIDLSDLPLSYLVLDKRPVAVHPPQTVRLIARAHCTKEDAVVITCDESGVKECLVTKKTLPDVYRSLKKNTHPALVNLELKGKKVVGVANVHKNEEL